MRAVLYEVPACRPEVLRRVAVSVGRLFFGGSAVRDLR